MIKANEYQKIAADIAGSTVYHEDATVSKEHLVVYLAKTFKELNPKFDELRFWKGCYTEIINDEEWKKKVSLLREMQEWI